MKTKPVAMLLIVALLWTIVSGDSISGAFAEAERIIMLPCASNMCDDWLVEVYVDERQGFISEDAAARFSGFTYLGGSTTTAYYERAGEEVAVPVAAEYEGRRWVALEWALYLLHTKVLVTEQGLVFDALKTTPHEVFAITDHYMGDGGRYNLMEEDDAIIDFGFNLSRLYHQITQMRLVGYDKAYYEELLRELLDIDGNTELVQLLLDADKVAERLEYLQGVGLEESDLLKTLDILGKLLDPVKTISNELCDMEGISISGLGFFEQVRLYAQIDAMMNLSSFGENMLGFTYTQEALDAHEVRPLYAPAEAITAIRRILTYAQETDETERVLQVLRDEARNVVAGTGESFVYNLIAQGPTPRIAAYILGEVNAALFPEITMAMDGVEAYGYLAELQSYLPSLYAMYRKSPYTAINAKYTTLFYLRIVQLALEKCAETGIIEAENYVFSETLEDAILELAAIDDDDIMPKSFTNDQIEADTLLSIYARTAGVQLVSGFRVGYVVMKLINSFDYEIQTEQDLLGLCCEWTWNSNDFDTVEFIAAHSREAQCSVIEYGRLDKNEEYYLFDIAFTDGNTRYNYEMYYWIYIGDHEAEEMYETNILSYTMEPIDSGDVPAWSGQEDIAGSGAFVPEVEEAASENYLGRMYVSNCSEWISLRESPATDSPRIAQIPLGAAVDVYGYDGQWGYCRYGDLSGFVLMEYLSYDAAGAMEDSQSAGAYPISDYLGENYLVFDGTYSTGRLVPQDPESLTAWATSELMDEYGTYPASNATDGDVHTAWAEGAYDIGAGETIYISTPSCEAIAGFAIMNGYQKDADTFYKNGRICTARVHAGDGYTDVELFDIIGWQYVEFEQSVHTDVIAIEILSAYPGSKYADVCVTELYPLTCP